MFHPPSDPPYVYGSAANQVVRYPYRKGDRYYTGNNEDPAQAGKRPDLKNKAIVPDVLMQAQSSTMQIVFYDAYVYPVEYCGAAFVTMRGSSNREEKTGFKVIRARMKDGSQWVFMKPS